jgi:hypothetical protein
MLATESDSSTTMSKDDFIMMLDEAMLLYASPSLHVDDSNNGIPAMRKKEVIDLVEDLLRLQRGDRPETPEEEEEEDDIITPTPLKAEPRQTLTEISHALDEAILCGYHSNLSEEELAQWVQQVGSLSTQLDHQLKALPSAESQVVSAITVSAETISPTPSSSSSPATALESTPRPTKQQLEARLEQLKILIDPLGSTRTFIPLVGSQTREEATPSTETSDDEPVVTANVGGLNTEEASPSSVIPVGAFFASVSDERIESPNTVKESPSSADGLAAMALSMEGDSVTTSAMDSEAADVISAVVSVAAISAAAVTKLPIFVAGVAMAPLVKSSIAYAQGRMSSANGASSSDVVAVEKCDAHADTTDAIGYSTRSEAQNVAADKGSFENSTTSSDGAKRKTQLLEPDVLGG